MPEQSELESLQLLEQQSLDDAIENLRRQSDENWFRTLSKQFSEMFRLPNWDTALPKNTI
jgi:hypothetical protein